MSAHMFVQTPNRLNLNGFFMCFFLCHQEQRALLKDLFQNHRERKTQRKTANRKTSRCAKMMKHVTLKYGCLLMFIASQVPLALWSNCPMRTWDVGWTQTDMNTVEPSRRQCDTSKKICSWPSTQQRSTSSRSIAEHRCIEDFKFRIFFHEKSILD